LAGGVFVEDLTPALFVFEDAELLQYLQILGGGLTLGNAGVDEELDLGVGLGEDQLPTLRAPERAGDIKGPNNKTPSSAFGQRLRRGKRGKRGS
jgi:hypothetical protein